MYIHTYTYVYTHIRIYIRLREYIFIYARTYIHVHTHAHHAHTHTHTHKRMHVYIRLSSGDAWQYLVHYSGWGNKYDEWVNEDLLYPDTDESRRVAASLRNSVPTDKQGKKKVVYVRI